MSLNRKHEYYKTVLLLTGACCLLSSIGTGIAGFSSQSSASYSKLLSVASKLFIPTLSLSFIISLENRFNTKGSAAWSFGLLSTAACFSLPFLTIPGLGSSNFKTIPPSLQGFAITAFIFGTFSAGVLAVAHRTNYCKPSRRGYSSPGLLGGGGHQANGYGSNGNTEGVRLTSANPA